MLKFNKMLVVAVALASTIAEAFAAATKEACLRDLAAAREAGAPRPTVVKAWSEALSALAAERSPALLYFCELMWHDGVRLSELPADVEGLLPPEVDCGDDVKILEVLRSHRRFASRRWPSPEKERRGLRIAPTRVVRTVEASEGAREALASARRRREPLLMKGIATSWRSRRWSLETLAEWFPRAVCRVAPTSAVSFCKESHPLVANGVVAAPSVAVSLTGSEAARRLLRADETVYVQALAPADLVATDIDLGYLGSASQLPRVWASRVGVSSPLHYDATDSHLVQVRGTKRLLLWPPSTLPELQPVLGDHPLARRCQLDLFSGDAEAVQSTALVAVLEPGDALWFPRDWAHYTEAVPGRDGDLSISLSLREDHGTLVGA